jgi:hypothetical protein
MNAETSKRKRPGAYEVGKYHPPKNTQFKKGQSGNPLGRPKKPVHVGTTIDGLLNRKISVLIDGKRVRISGADALLRKAFNEALKGDYRMMKLFLAFAQQRPDATGTFDTTPDDAKLDAKVEMLLTRLRAEKAQKEKEEAQAKKD